MRQGTVLCRTFAPKKIACQNGMLLDCLFYSAAERLFSHSATAGDTSLWARELT